MAAETKATPQISRLRLWASLRQPQPPVHASGHFLHIHWPLATIHWPLATIPDHWPPWKIGFVFSPTDSVISDISQSDLTTFVDCKLALFGAFEPLHAPRGGSSGRTRSGSRLSAECRQAPEPQPADLQRRLWLCRQLPRIGQTSPVEICGSLQNWLCFPAAGPVIIDLNPCNSVIYVDSKLALFGAFLGVLHAARDSRADWRTKSSSRALRGCKSPVECSICSSISLGSTWSSAGMTVRAVMLCLKVLRRTRCLP